MKGWRKEHFWEEIYANRWFENYKFWELMIMLDYSMTETTILSNYFCNLFRNILVVLIITLIKLSAAGRDFFRGINFHTIFRTLFLYNLLEKAYCFVFLMFFIAL